MIQYIKSVLCRVAERLSYIEDARCLKVKHSYIHSYVFSPQSVVGKALCPFNGNNVHSVALGQFPFKLLPVLTIHTPAYFTSPPRECSSYRLCVDSAKRALSRIRHAIILYVPLPFFLIYFFFNRSVGLIPLMPPHFCSLFFVETAELRWKWKDIGL